MASNPLADDEWADDDSDGDQTPDTTRRPFQSSNDQSVHGGPDAYNPGRTQHFQAGMSDGSDGSSE